MAWKKPFALAAGMLALLSLAGSNTRWRRLGDLDEVLAQATRAYRAKKKEEAAHLLREARGLARDDAENRAAELARIGGMLRRADPLAATRERTGRKIAKLFVGLAGRYRRQGWLEEARRILEDNAHRAPRLAQRPLLAIGKEFEEKSSAKNRSFHDLFHKGPRLGTNMGWQLTHHEAVSPRPDGTSSMIASNRLLPARIRVRLEMKLGDYRSRASVCFGYRNRQALLAVDLAHRDGEMPFTALKDYYLDDKGAQVKGVPLWPNVYVRGDWTPVEVVIRGEKITIKVGRAEPYDYTALGRDLSGRLGLLLAEGHGDGPPVRYRDLRIEVLK